ncbi:MAG: cupin domain-containing protein [Kofleriaceae bacterium]|nr:cupin domain-containing protein [Kofleriaceae bacterium]
MFRASAAAALIVAACSQPASAPAGSPIAPVSPAPGGSAASVPAPADAPAVSQEETLAAIQKAMNELDEAAQACWAVAATERFDIEGTIEMTIEIEPTSAKATVTSDTTHNAQLAGCLQQLLGAYRWAPPLHGQTIRLPFQFRAPDGQSVIDRQHVTWRGQDKVRVAVLLDENNTGNGAASMFEVAIAAGGSTGWRKAEKPEVWYFLGPARVTNPPSSKAAYRDVAAGDMMYVEAGEVRDVAAVQDVHAVIVTAPGGREGSARAGALPTPSAQPAKKAVRILPASAAKTYGPATIYLEPALAKGAPFAASVLSLAAGANVPEHVHAQETEMLYVVEGQGTMTIAGQQIAVTPTSVIQIPPGIKHAFAATAAVRAVQVYTPAGPEQRFKKQ